jgi:hypothetical protein
MFEKFKAWGRGLQARPTWAQEATTHGEGMQTRRGGRGRGGASEDRHRGETARYAGGHCVVMQPPLLRRRAHEQ